MEDEPTWTAIGDEVAEARKKAYASRRAAADALGVSESHLRNIENGRRLAKGPWMAPTVSDITLARVLIGLELDPVPRFQQLGREVPPPRLLDGPPKREAERPEAPTSEELERLYRWARPLLLEEEVRQARPNPGGGRRRRRTATP